jgi:hypothetical protein
VTEDMPISFPFSLEQIHSGTSAIYLDALLNRFLQIRGMKVLGPNQCTWKLSSNRVPYPATLAIVKSESLKCHHWLFIWRCSDWGCEWNHCIIIGWLCPCRLSWIHEWHRSDFKSRLFHVQIRSNVINWTDSNAFDLLNRRSMKDRPSHRSRSVICGRTRTFAIGPVLSWTHFATNWFVTQMVDQSTSTEYRLWQLRFGSVENWEREEAKKLSITRNVTTGPIWSMNDNRFHKMVLSTPPGGKYNIKIC